MTTQTTFVEKLNDSLKLERELLLERKDLLEEENQRLAEINFWMIYREGWQHVGFI